MASIHNLTVTENYQNLASGLGDGNYKFIMLFPASSGMCSLDVLCQTGTICLATDTYNVSVQEQTLFDSNNEISFQAYSPVDSNLWMKYSGSDMQIKTDVGKTIDLNYKILVLSTSWI
jgi:hypothetical protein